MTKTSRYRCVGSWTHFKVPPASSSHSDLFKHCVHKLSHRLLSKICLKLIIQWSERIPETIRICFRTTHRLATAANGGRVNKDRGQLVGISSQLWPPSDGSTAVLTAPLTGTWVSVLVLRGLVCSLRQTDRGRAVFCVGR